MKHLFPIFLALPLLLGVTGYKGPTDKGNEDYNKGNYEEALGHYRDAAGSAPDSPEAHYNLGNAYYRLGEYAKALEEYEDARRLDPKMADADYNAGDTLFRMEKYEDALKAYGQAKSAYGKKGDPDTEYNIKVTKERIEKKKEQELKKQQKQGRNDKGSGKDDKQKRQPGAGGQGGQTQGGEHGRPAGQPPMSNEELKALMDRQANEEKKLRNYFQPGKDNGSDREDEIEQMLRGMGSGPEKRTPRPGQPHVEKDW